MILKYYSQQERNFLQDAIGHLTGIVLRYGGAGSGNFGHSGRPGEQGGSGPSNGTKTRTASAWLKDWTFGGEKMELWKSTNVGDDLIKELAPYRPTKPIKLYRAHRIGTPHTDLESWTTDRGLAESIVEGDDNPKTPIHQILSKTTSPHEIFVHAGMLPKSWEADVLESEVIVAATPTMVDRLKNIRKTLTTRQWVSIAKRN